MKTNQLFCAAVAWCYSLIASWTLQSEQERQWKQDPPKSRNHLLQWQPVLMSSWSKQGIAFCPRVLIRNGPDLGSYSPSIFTSIPNARKDRGHRSRETVGLWSSYSYSFLKLVWKQQLVGLHRTLHWWIHRSWKERCKGAILNVNYFTVWFTT